jgi:predicted RNA-binding protein with PUA-like domain
VRTGVIDETQFDPESKYFEPKATREKPIWDCVDVEFVQRMPRFVALGEIRAEPACSDMLLLQRGMRLSVQPITETHYKRIVALSKQKPKIIVEPPKAKAAPKAKAKAKPAAKKKPKK